MNTAVRHLFGLVFVLLASTPSVSGVTTIMPFGDSITRGFLGNDPANGSYRQYIENQLTALDVSFDLVGNYRVLLGGIDDADYQAVGGYNIEKMVNEFGASIKQHQPDFMLILAGTNNIWSRPDHDEFVQRYESLVQLANDNAPNTRMIFATVPPLGCCHSDKGYWTPEWVADRNSLEIQTMNAALRAVADRHDFVTIAEYDEVFDVSVDLSDDDLHPNGHGQRKLGRVFLDELGDLRFGLLGAENIDRLSAVIAAGSETERGDLNADGVVDADDHTYLIEDVIGTTSGDSNLDGRFDSDDLLAVFKVGEYEDDISGNSGWADGDWNGDAEFNTTDLIHAYRKGAFEKSTLRVVPEPYCSNLFVVVAMFMFVNGARRSSRLTLECSQTTQIDKLPTP